MDYAPVHISSALRTAELKIPELRGPTIVSKDCLRAQNQQCALYDADSVDMKRERFKRWRE
jgi:hypothetical protein